MKQERIGVIDLGTNTFHLLIVELDAGRIFRELHRERRYIKLAEGGIDRISDAAFQRGLESMKAFAAILKKLEVEQVNAIGTAALRTASNGKEFVQAVREQSGLEIELISGDREAALIHKGVSLAVPLEDEPDLIMDIGGGSVEFILANKEQVFWAQSFPVGVAVLYRTFHKQEPITQEEKDVLSSFLNNTLSPLWQAAKTWEPRRLIGASGTFDVLESLLTEGKDHPHHAVVSLEPFYPLASLLIGMNHEERLEKEGVPASRADMIVVAMLLIREVLEHIPMDEIVVSKYAMKEGMIAELV